MQTIKFYNSGLYDGPSFYKTYNIEDILFDGYALHVNYNRELMRTRYSNAELENLDDNQIDDLIDDDFHKDIAYHYTLYSPHIFKEEEVALDCGLIPFTYIKENIYHLQLLALVNGGHRFTRGTLLFKLDAYQVLSGGSVDEKSRIFDRAYEDAHKKIVGTEIYNKVIKVIGNEVIW